MAFHDGMQAVSKVLKVVAVASALIFACAALANSRDGSVFWLLGTFSFLLFWTPAWLIRKFIQ